jgi:hypothetical protein
MFGFFFMPSMGLNKPIDWFKIALTAYLKVHDFEPLPLDPCVLQNDAGELLVFWWVDDIAIISPILAGIQRIKDLLSNQFKVCDLGELCDYLGLNITRDRPIHHLYLMQHSYIRRFLVNFICRMLSLSQLQHPTGTP